MNKLLLLIKTQTMLTLFYGTTLLYNYSNYTIILFGLKEKQNDSCM